MHRHRLNQYIMRIIIISFVDVHWDGLHRRPTNQPGPVVRVRGGGEGDTVLNGISPREIINELLEMNF